MNMEKVRRLKATASFLILLAGSLTGLLHAQGFLHADGKRIVDGSGENVILRGIGTGNWMIQEGYMMKTEGIAGTQHEFRARLEQEIGEARTDTFYTAWLSNHFTRTDADSLSSWGFNSVRVAMHYKWFTLPIEEEPVPGQQTWLETGFTMIDSLLDWCGDNGMYLILDLHGAPGGQGKNADISDYDPTKPSLWESDANKDKTVALWKKLAERYAAEPWIGGYDLINETNWPLGSNNSALRSLYGRITDSIRAVDPNHLLFIEGNDFANNFSGLTPPWDDNMAYSFHKYRNYNDVNSIGWVLALRDQYNVPIWLGESGEDSNTWGTNMVRLCESENIGWVWWPQKKGGINNPLNVQFNDDYLQLVNHWRGNGPALSADGAYRAVMTLAERHHISRCVHQRDLIDALFRQPHTTETLPFTSRSAGDRIFATEYDLGRNGYAYLDMDTADYQFSTGGDFISWNQGWAFRNDGVDMEACTDGTTNGYNVGWTETGEWLTYTLDSDSAAAYALEIRSAAGGTGARIRLEVNGVDATGTVQLPSTGGWANWQTTQVEEVILPAGRVQVSIVYQSGGSNLNWFRFKDPVPESGVSFRMISAMAEGLESEVEVHLNKEVSEISGLSVLDFTLTAGAADVDIESIALSGSDPRVLVLKPAEPLSYNQVITLSYDGSGIFHDLQELESVSGLVVRNALPRHFVVPGTIQAEDFFTNNGLELEDCLDAGGGQNTGYAHVGDYLDYVVLVPEAGNYALDFRVASAYSGGRLSVQVDGGTGFQTIATMNFTSTGGWQNWETQSTEVELPEGKYLLRLLVTGNEHNLNWMKFSKAVGIHSGQSGPPVILYPNPASDHVRLRWAEDSGVPKHLQFFDHTGRLVHASHVSGSAVRISVSEWPEGIYTVSCLSENGDLFRTKLIIVH